MTVLSAPKQAHGAPPPATHAGGRTQAAPHPSTRNSLAAQLDAAPEQRYAPAQVVSSGPDPVGAYLRSLTVSGFRGIGPAATLDVQPGPGLSLVVGRNGSGKSSFAEALEVLLTGTLMRWSPSTPVVFKEGWQNKHAASGADIRAEFLMEGKGRATVARTWTAHADLANSSAWLQVAGEKRESIDALGWGNDLRATTGRSCPMPSLRRSSDARRSCMTCWPRCLAWTSSPTRPPG